MINFKTLTKDLKIAFIGGGQMATALLGGLLKAGMATDTLQVVEPDAQQRKRLEDTFGIKTEASPGDGLAKATVVVWAVKPQMMREAIRPLRDQLGDRLHISIAAGLGLAPLSAWLGTERLIRAMPNTAALIGEGVIGLAAASGANDADKKIAQELFASAGFSFWTDSDERLDAVTAISGSGPGYVFHFLEAFQHAAESLGFAPDMARELVLRTALGAVRQAQQGESFGVLRERVSSKHGTTEAAVDVLNKAHSAAILRDAVRAAYERSKEINAASSPGPI